jgi:putative CocE/NonD family hydrolase
MQTNLDILVPMRDGVRLALDLYRPDGPGPFPVLMERTPYGKHLPSRGEITLDAPDAPISRAAFAQQFTDSGYAVAFQDKRGRYASEGRYRKYLDDANDGYDTCAWLVEQPWCNEKIGTFGLSYSAHTQAALASLNAPGLAAMWLDSGGFSNAFHSGIRQGGAFELKQATWAYKQARLSPEADSDPVLAAALAGEDINAWFTRMPWRPGHSPLRHHLDYEAYMFEQWGQVTDGPFWRQASICAEAFWPDFADVPQVHMSSWFDPYARTATDNYLGLKAAGKVGPLRLILGPWTHGDRTLTYAGDVDFGPQATLDSVYGCDFLKIRERWFDQWIMGPDNIDKDNGTADEPAVRVFVMGGGSGQKNTAGRLDHGGAWIEAADWPLPEASPTAFYLHADGTLSPSAPDQAASVTYVSDPKNPVPTIGGAFSSGEPVFTAGAYNQVEDPRFFGCAEPYLPLASRPDVCVFQTEPLTEDMAIAGPVTARIWVSSDALDTDLHVKLVDVYPASPDYPQGFAMNLTHGLLRLSFSESWSERRLFEPGQAYAVEVPFFPVANRFQAGHRIRLDVSSSNFPMVDVNPQTGENPTETRDWRVARNTLLMGPGQASHVELPLLPVSSLG